MESSDPDKGASRPRALAAHSTLIVVPCFNEERRLDVARFIELADAKDVQLLFVDDGSSDGTGRVLSELAARKTNIAFLRLSKNGGKGEAVRQGMLAALAKKAEAPVIVGYADADLSTPPEELVRLRDEMTLTGVSVVTAARVALIGRDIRRRAARHYLGRVFATVASGILDAPFYDTQCGAKFFRSSTLLREVLEKPFRSRWAFDVELLGRLLVGTRANPPLERSAFLEVPLYHWEDVGGSKLKTSGMIAAVGDLASIAFELAELRRARRS